jgi:Uncharacterized protein conserved in bacteria (DUF2130)
MSTSVTESCPWCGSTIPHARFLEIQQRIRAEEQRRVSTMEADFKKRETAIRQQVETTVNQRVLLAQQQAEQQRKKELAAQRASLEKERDSQLLKRQADFSREKEGLQKTVLELQRQVERKTPNDLGDGAEIDVYEALRDAFPGDKITRVDKGQPGGDILHEVLHKGASCGRILIDAKNRQQWKYDFVTKLRADQTDAGAEHAILATTVFPSGKKELAIESDVILVNPARTVHIVTLLRAAMVQTHVRGLSIKERATKMSRLYEFITSPTYAQRVREAEKLTDDILELDVQEKKTHDNVWKKRGTLATRLNAVLREVDTDVAGIVEAHEPAISAA